MQIKKPQHLQALRELLAGTRYLLCVDLEATCDEYPTGLTDELKPEDNRSRSCSSRSASGLQDRQRVHQLRAPSAESDSYRLLQETDHD